VKIISWNIAHRSQPWYWLLEMDADLALLQEAAEPPPEVAKRIEVDPEPWRTAGADAHTPRPWRAAVVRLSDRVHVDWIESKPIAEAASGELAVSRPGTLAAAWVTSPGGERFVAVSMYAAWMRPHASTGSNWIVSDASAHHVISDLSAFIGSQHGHHILAAGDLNILYGYGDYGSAYWRERYRTVFTRMESLGLPFAGPQAPHGRQSDPWPDELPRGSKNVPTYYSNRQAPATATRQLDYVFASRSLAENMKVRALNEPEQWGPSDHCRLEIEVS
jgi:endonuclease/exonuclease/phosphatase family metal-dependent hydrolase